MRARAQGRGRALVRVGERVRACARALFPLRTGSPAGVWVRALFLGSRVPWLAKRAGFPGGSARRKAGLSAGVHGVLPLCLGAALRLPSEALRLSSATTRESRCCCHLPFPGEEGGHREVKPRSFEFSVVSESTSFFFFF